MAQRINSDVRFAAMIGDPRNRQHAAFLSAPRGSGAA
jgi:hypothetical protein